MGTTKWPIIGISGRLEYLESGFLPGVVQPEFTAAPSATGGMNLQPWPPDSATMRQARQSSSAMLAKYTAWVTAPGRRAGENEVKRTPGDQGRKTAAQPADHR